MAAVSLLDPWLVLLRDHPLLAWMWIVMVGSCIGSFLNVVVYRLPAGMSLSRPGSHCPGCGHAIRWHDNVPILGWLLLRGRCRDCRQPIAARYPLVELLVALLFGWLWYLDAFAVAPASHEDLASPGDAVAIGAGVLRFLGHALWLVPLLAMALIEADGQRVPRSLLLFAGASAMLVVACMLGLLPEAAQGELWRGISGEAREGLATRVAVRLVAGMAVGLAVWMLVQLRAARRGQGTSGAQARLPDALIVGGLTGLYCGANVVPVLLLAHLLVLLGQRPLRSRTGDEAASSRTPRTSRSSAKTAARATDKRAADKRAAEKDGAATSRFRFGWLAAVLLLTLFWLD